MTNIDRTIAAIADPTRRAILRRLAHTPRRAGELALGFAISRPAVCKHTKLLARAGLIRARKNGRERVYELAPAGSNAMRRTIAELQEIERYWTTVLDAFKRFAENSK